MFKKKMKRICTSFVLFAVFSCSANDCKKKNCDTMGIAIYKDMKCTPLAPDCYNCPTKYSCPNIKNDTVHYCYNKGKKYEVNQVINSTENLCDGGCVCSRRNEGVHIFCGLILECAEYFGITPKEGCYRTYDLIKCCSLGQNCPKETSPKPHECVVDGRTYKEGERFFPNTSCSMCVCQKGFKGKYEAPFCVPRRCNVELKDSVKIQQSCAPVYLRQQDLDNKIMCCPSTWICPDGEEVIAGKPKSDDTCKFGDIKLKLGQQLETNLTYIGRSQGVICKCNIPPLLTCVKDEYKNLLN